jgi:hypothetical protein
MGDIPRYYRQTISREILESVVPTGMIQEDFGDGAASGEGDLCSLASPSFKASFKGAHRTGDSQLLRELEPGSSECE